MKGTRSKLCKVQQLHMLWFSSFSISIIWPLYLGSIHRCYYLITTLLDKSIRGKTLPIFSAILPHISAWECWKWCFKASNFQNFLGKHAPRLPTYSHLRHSLSRFMMIHRLDTLQLCSSLVVYWHFLSEILNFNFWWHHQWHINPLCQVESLFQVWIHVCQRFLPEISNFEVLMMLSMM